MLPKQPIIIIFALLLTMYNFSYFKESEQQIILEFIRNNPFAFLTGSFMSGHQVATQIPLLLEERNGELYLQGHFMRNTDHHKAYIENPNALVVFSGPHCYVSASWYSNPHIGSTWNYMSVHASGNIRFMDDSELIAFMRKLTLTFEKGNTESLTYYDNLPQDFLNKMLPAIVGIEIRVDKMDNVFKLSQNRDEWSYNNIISQLEKLDTNSQVVAEEMKNRREKLFPVGENWDASKFDS